MSIVELSGLITAIGVMLTSIATIINIGISLRNGLKIKAVHEVALQVRTEANGMKSELVKEVRAASFAQGVKSEVDKK